MSVLEQVISLNVLAFILTFVRVGTTIMIMPGIGDSFVSAQIRLFFAVAFSFVLMPLIAFRLPVPLPTGGMLLILVLIEFLIGLFLGTVSRILMSATDTAGMIISFQTGLSNAQLFNPQFASQGSLIGAFLSVTGATLLFVTDLHHLLIMGMVESYDRFPVGRLPDVGSLADVIARAVSAAFSIGVQIAAPFLVLILVMYVALGVLTRLMPQLQIFIIALPAQILLALLILSLTFSAGALLFLDRFSAYVGSIF